jgi:hypothetical protein
MHVVIACTHNIVDMVVERLRAIELLYENLRDRIYRNNVSSGRARCRQVGRMQPLSGTKEDDLEFMNVAADRCTKTRSVFCNTLKHCTSRMILS